jgi:predicted RNase H-like nuclease (RuvC/YqgF family)
VAKNWGGKTMRVLIVPLLVGTLAGSAYGGEVFKCVENGKTVFQGTPCRGDGAKVVIKPANGTEVGSENPGKPDASASAPTLTKLKQSVAAMEVERKQREIGYDIRDLERDIDRYQSAMERELAALERKKSRANNNLAGATWEQSISTEMQAVTTKYQSKIQVAQQRIAQLRQQADELSKHP